MKKFLTLWIAMVLLVTMAACSGGEPSTSGSGTGSGAGSGSPAGEILYKIGVVQLTEHDALDAAYRGFVDGLKEAGYEDGANITIDFQNAQGEQANCVTIADKLVNDGNDLILAIATPAAQAVANKTSTIPILVTAVTDPADAKLVQSNEAPGTNVTGTSDLNPIKEQMELMVKLVPDVKTVGMLYSSSEANSSFQVALARKQLESMGIASVDFTVSNSNEIQQVVQSMVGKVDAIYAPTDNTVAAGMPNVAMVANAAKLPVIVGEGNMVYNGALATDGLNYYNLGKQTAAMAVRILVDGANPAEMPIEYLQETELVVNKTTADAIGVSIPADVADRAEIVE